jgi:Cysteine rich repeat
LKTIGYALFPALALAAGLAFAADAPPTGGARAACKADAEKFCSSVQPGGGRVKACMKQNEAQLSQPCKDALAKAHDKKAPSTPAAPQG